MAGRSPGWPPDRMESPTVRVSQRNASFGARWPQSVSLLPYNKRHAGLARTPKPGPAGLRRRALCEGIQNTSRLSPTASARDPRRKKSWRATRRAGSSAAARAHHRQRRDPESRCAPSEESHPKLMSDRGGRPKPKHGYVRHAQLPRFTLVSAKRAEHVFQGADHRHSRVYKKGRPASFLRLVRMQSAGVSA